MNGLESTCTLIVNHFESICHYFPTSTVETTTMTSNECRAFLSSLHQWIKRTDAEIDTLILYWSRHVFPILQPSSSSLLSFLLPEDPFSSFVSSSRSEEDWKRLLRQPEMPSLLDVVVREGMEKKRGKSWNDFAYFFQGIIKVLDGRWCRLSSLLVKMETIRRERELLFQHYAM
jgi:hypothetical protein